jgi:hypothetical protein
MKDNQGILAIIAVALIAIAGVMIYQTTQGGPAEEVAESISGAIDSAAGK